MLNRRYLRIKVLQFLYAYTQGNDLTSPIQQKNLFKSIDNVHRLYFKMLLLYLEVFRAAEGQLERGMKKRFATPEELNPNRRFIENKAYQKLAKNTNLLEKLDELKLDWSLEESQIKAVLKRIKSSSLYEKYMQKEKGSFKEDQQFAIAIYEGFLMDNEAFEYILEEEDMHWATDLDLVHITVLRTLQQLRGSFDEHSQISPKLYKDEVEDKQFVRDLLKLTVKHDEEFSELIKTKTDNWEIERIAKIDIILLKMALCEILYHPSIPVKVTINEYIELSKHFSTVKSRAFINGILDNLIGELKAGNKIKKIGRGLIG